MQSVGWRVQGSECGVEGFRFVRGKHRGQGREVGVENARLRVPMVLQRPFGHLHLWLAASFKAPYTCLLGLSACFFCIWSVFRFMDVALQGFTGFCSFCRALNGFYAVFFACTVY